MKTQRFKSNQSSSRSTQSISKSAGSLVLGVIGLMMVNGLTTAATGRAFAGSNATAQYADPLDGGIPIFAASSNPAAPSQAKYADPLDEFGPPAAGPTHTDTGQTRFAQPLDSLPVQGDSDSRPITTQTQAPSPNSEPSASSPTTAPAATAQVAIDNFAFKPQNLTIAVGTTVTWVNQDDVPHTATAKAKPRAFDSGSLDTDQKFSFTFKTPGTYTYFCAVHPHMTGTITVK